MKNTKNIIADSKVTKTTNSKKVTTPVVVETKAEMIRKFIAEGMANSAIIKAVKEVYVTCYYSEVTRLRTA